MRYEADGEHGKHGEQAGSDHLYTFLLRSMRCDAMRCDAMRCDGFM
jgi:hypothetical protein